MEQARISEIIMQEIGKNHRLGEQAGGSGHLSSVNAGLESVQVEPLEQERLKVTYRYFIHVESEFTVYGENDPVPDIYEYEMLLDKNGTVLSNTYLRLVQSSMQEADFLPPRGWIPTDEDRFYFDRLDRAYDKGYTTAENEEAIRWFHTQYDEIPDFLLHPTESFGKNHFVKSMWENHLRVLEKWIQLMDVQLYFCSLICDPNWPGFGFARHVLLSLIWHAIPAINQTLETSQNDPDMVDQLEDLKSDILVREKKLTEEIKRFISDHHHEQYPQYPKRQISLNHLNPYRNRDEGNYWYWVEYKVIDPDLDAREPGVGIRRFSYENEVLQPEK